MPRLSQTGEPLSATEVAGGRRIRERERGEAEEEAEKARPWDFSSGELCHRLRLLCNLIPRARAVLMI